MHDNKPCSLYIITPTEFMCMLLLRIKYKYQTYCIEKIYGCYKLLHFTR